MIRTIETIMVKCFNPAVYLIKFTKLNQKENTCKLYFLTNICWSGLWISKFFVSNWFTIHLCKGSTYVRITQWNPYKVSFSPRLDISDLLRRLLNMLKHLNQHFGIKPTYINKQILLSESLHIKSQSQILPNPVHVVQQTTLTRNAPLFVWHRENCLNCNKQKLTCPTDPNFSKIKIKISQKKSNLFL